MRRDLVPKGAGLAGLAIGGGVLADGPVTLIRRTLPGAIAGALDALPPEALPRLRHDGDLADIGRELRRAVHDRSGLPVAVGGWLAADILELAALMADLTRAKRLRVRLDPIDDDRCSRFHVDDVTLRLVTTYRGPGTEWVDQRGPDRGAALPDELADRVRRLERGEVAVMRGGRDATPERPGLLHRSPPISGTGITRLFLAIDGIERATH